MDFSFSDDQSALQDLARRILTEATSVERVRTAMASADGFDHDLWRAMADAGLVGIGLPESVGGGGLGFLETCIVLEEVGRTAAPVPALAVMALGAPALAEFGGDLDGVTSGERIVTAALTEAVGDPRSPLTACVDGHLVGEKICVPAGTVADTFVVSASPQLFGDIDRRTVDNAEELDEGDGLYVVDAGAPGLTVERQDTTSGVPEARLTLDGVPAVRLAGAEGVRWLVERAQAAMAVTMAGVCEAALRLTAEYAKSRVQFDRPIASFQAVSQRVGDAYIDTEAVRLTAWQAAWRIATGRPHAEQVAVAKFWAAEAGQRVVHAAQHVHGGVGVDRDYPLHRYFLLAKQLELGLGSATPSLAHLGRLIAAV